MPDYVKKRRKDNHLILLNIRPLLTLTRLSILELKMTEGWGLGGGHNLFPLCKICNIGEDGMILIF